MLEALHERTRDDWYHDGDAPQRGYDAGYGALRLNRGPDGERPAPPDPLVDEARIEAARIRLAAGRTRGRHGRQDEAQTDRVDP